MHDKRVEVGDILRRPNSTGVTNDFKDEPATPAGEKPPLVVENPRDHLHGQKHRIHHQQRRVTAQRWVVTTVICTFVEEFQHDLTCSGRLRDQAGLCCRVGLCCDVLQDFVVIDRCLRLDQVVDQADRRR